MENVDWHWHHSFTLTHLGLPLSLSLLCSSFSLSSSCLPLLLFIYLPLFSSTVIWSLLSDRQSRESKDRERNIVQTLVAPPPVHTHTHLQHPYPHQPSLSTVPPPNHRALRLSLHPLPLSSISPSLFLKQMHSLTTTHSDAFLHILKYSLFSKKSSRLANSTVQH